MSVDRVPVERISAELAEGKSELATLQDRRARLESEIGSLAEQRRGAQRRMQIRARALYRMSRAGMLPLAGGVSSLLGYLGRRQRLERMVRMDVESLRTLRTRSDALRGEMLRVAESMEAMGQRVSGLEARQRSVADAQTLFGGNLGVTQRVFPGLLGGSSLLGGGPSFTEERGRLATPIAGTFSLRDGQREDGRGLEFVAAPGTPVRAAAEGQVAYADTYGGYGRMLILDHRDGYYTVYAGLGSFDVTVGDYVGRGARLGTVGAESSPPALFFEVRRGTRSQDPRPWLGL